jgi:hypothetical protein
MFDLNKRPPAHGTPSAAPGRLVREGLERTVEKGTAAMSYSFLESSTRQWELDPPGDRIDFRSRCSIQRGSVESQLITPGRILFGNPGAWELTDDELEEVWQEDPFWLLELVDTIEQASDEGTDKVRNDRCRRYRATIHFMTAAASARRRLQTPIPFDLDPPGTAPVDVWLDDLGRVRAVRLYRSSGRASLELERFGQVVPVPVPGDEEILEDED